MATQLQLRRGNTTQTNAFTGAIAEVTVDTDKKTLVIHDGSTAGGTPLAKEGVLSTAYTHANGAFDKANSANVLAQAAYNQANTATTSAQAAFDKANQTAQLAFTTVSANGTSLVADANNDTLTITSAVANGVFVTGNSSTDALDIGLIDSGVTASGYGDSVSVPTFVVDTKGRLTSASNTSIRSGTTTQTGIVQLEDSVISTSTSNAATPASVKTTYDLATTANNNAVNAGTYANAAFDKANSAITANSVATLNNKTFDVSVSSNNIFSIQGQSITSYSGSGQVVILQNSPTISVLNLSDSQLNLDGGTGSSYWSGQSGVAQASDLKAGVYSSDPTSNNSLFTFGGAGANNMSVAVEGSLFIGTAMPSNNGGLNTTYPGWLVVQSGAKFGGTINTLGALQFDDPATANIIFADGTTQNTAYKTIVWTTANSAFDKANSANVIAQAAFDNSNTKFSSSGGSISGDVSVTGNLTIIGQTIYANTTTALIADNVLTLNAAINQASAPTVNAGVEVDRGSSANVSLLWNESSDKWTFTNDGSTYYDIADAARLDSSFTHANSAFNQANTATTTAGLAYTHANGAFDKANTVATTAQNAYDLANGTAGIANTDYTTVSVTAGTYGNATYVPTVTLASNGRVTSVTTTAISAGASIGDVLALSIALG